MNDYLKRIAELEAGLAELRKEVEASQLDFEVGDELTDGKFWGIVVDHQPNGEILVACADGSLWYWGTGDWKKTGRNLRNAGFAEILKWGKEHMYYE